MGRAKNEAYERKFTCTKCGRRITPKVSRLQKRQRPDGGWDHWPTCNTGRKSQLTLAEIQERRLALWRQQD